MKQKLGIVFLFLFSMTLTQASAGLENAPPHFAYKDDRAVFVDFKNAFYKITYDLKLKKAQIEATIEFENLDRGYPLFDMIENPTLVTLDGKSVSVLSVRDPHAQTTYRVLSENTFVGKHELKIKAPLTDLVEWSNNGVFNAFWTNDLGDRGFLENYLPTSFEYDQYLMKFEVEFLNATVEQEIYTNGTKMVKGKNLFTIDFPEYFNSSAIFFHTAPKNYYKEVKFSYKSISGKTIPAIAYSATLNVEDFKNKSLNVLAELEGLFGPFPHPTVTIYAAGSGGMEYHGATMTDLWALGHELTHSYFARGMMPAQGDAGWMDEAIASWRDKGYLSSQTPNFSSSIMGNHSPYRRATDRDAYTKGASFMAHLNYLLQGQGGLKVLLKKVLEQNLFKPIKTVDFQNLVNTAWGRSSVDLFNKYIYGLSGVDKDSMESEVHNPYHPQRSKAELKKLMFK